VPTVHIKFMRRIPNKDYRFRLIAAPSLDRTSWIAIGDDVDELTIQIPSNFGWQYTDLYREAHPDGSVWVHCEEKDVIYRTLRVPYRFNSFNYKTKPGETIVGKTRWLDDPAFYIFQNEPHQLL